MLEIQNGFLVAELASGFHLSHQSHEKARGKGKTKRKKAKGKSEMSIIRWAYMGKYFE
jgi:hypothetical protein